MLDSNRGTKENKISDKGIVECVCRGECDFRLNSQERPTEEILPEERPEGSEEREPVPGRILGRMFGGRPAAKRP